MRLGGIDLYVSDLAASRAFYEGHLGFRATEPGPVSVTYRAGQMTMRLIQDAGRAPASRDRSVDITLLVDDLDPMRAALEARGVRVSSTLDYIVGRTADFYDPDGHWFSLYEPSEEALGWPSGAKIRELRDDLEREPDRLDGHELVYLFVFVEDADSTQAFYYEVLGLEAIEGGPCRRGVTHLPEGVVKYDGGATLLTTHAVDEGHAAAHRVSVVGSGALAMVLEVPDVAAEAARLAGRGVAFAEEAAFHDPAGHRYRLTAPAIVAARR